jgi:hypothetical protein
MGSIRVYPPLFFQRVCKSIKTRYLRKWRGFGVCKLLIMLVLRVRLK